MLFRFIAPHKTLGKILDALVDHICQRCHEHIRLLPCNASVLEPLHKRIRVKVRSAPQQQGRRLSQGHTHPRHSRPQPHIVVRDPRGMWGGEQGDMIKWRCVCNYLYGAGRKGIMAHWRHRGGCVVAPAGGGTPQCYFGASGYVRADQTRSQGGKSSR